MTDVQSIQTRLDFIGIDHATKDALRDLRPLIAKALPGLLDKFYAHLAKYPQVARLFADQTSMRRAKQAQIDHWAMIANANFDDAYMASVARIGQTHARLGLEPRWYMAAYSLIMTGLSQAIESE